MKQKLQIFLIKLSRIQVKWLLQETM